MMNRDDILSLLREHKATLARRYGVTDIALFGSVARNRPSEHSDIDLLVRFDGPATSKRYFGVQFYIEDLTGRPVDLVTDKAFESRAEARRRKGGHPCLTTAARAGAGISTSVT